MKRQETETLGQEDKKSKTQRSLNISEADKEIESINQEMPEVQEKSSKDVSASVSHDSDRSDWYYDRSDEKRTLRASSRKGRLK